MLKGDSFNQIVKHNNLIATQLNHLSKSPTSIRTRLDSNFIANFQMNYPNPSKVYEMEMKSMFKDDLESCLVEQAEKLNQQRESFSNQPKDIQARLDGVLCQLQKNNFSNNLSLQKKKNRREERKQWFIDEDRLKNSKIQSIAQKWQNKDLFSHESDIYQNYQKQQHVYTLQMLRMQREAKIEQKLLKQRQKELQRQNRLKHEREMELIKFEAARNKIENQKKYGNQLAYLAQQKKMRQSLIRVPTEPILRHNPITNPLQYHIDNPYLLKRMQERQR